jgi:uncharacterized protein (DUF1684 family)
MIHVSGCAAGRGVAIVSLSTAIVLTLACSGRETQRPGGADDPVVAERREKDAAFRSSPGSPIPERDRGRFYGLKYYPPDPSLRFHVKLNRYPAPQTLRLGTNTGEVRSALRYGYFEFQIGGRICRLQVYRMEDSPDAGGPRLFIPFRDATSGKETYASGRYIDLRENTTGMYELDFNRAYNPSCAYSEGFSCPVPPPENTLEVAVRAGEMNYPLAVQH